MTVLQYLLGSGSRDPGVLDPRSTGSETHLIPICRKSDPRRGRNGPILDPEMTHFGRVWTHLMGSGPSRAPRMSSRAVQRLCEGHPEGLAQREAQAHRPSGGQFGGLKRGPQNWTPGSRSRGSQISRSPDLEVPDLEGPRSRGPGIPRSRTPTSRDDPFRGSSGGARYDL